MTEAMSRIDIESLARSLHFDWVDQHGYPNGLQTWDELPDRSPTNHAADMHCKATWRSLAESVHATIRALQEENEGLSNFRDQIIKHYENQYMSHLDFRVHAYKHALTLKDTPNAD